MIWSIVTRGQKEEERAQTEFIVWNPPPWEAEATVSDAAVEADAEAFMDAFANFKRG